MSIIGIRKAKYKLTHKRIYLLCEGTKTEPQYFEWLKREYRIPLEIIEKYNKRNDAKSLLKIAGKFCSENNSKNQRIELWIIIDLDDRKNKDKCFDKIKRWKPKKNNIEGQTVLSAPQFEFWLLLHFENGKNINGKEDCLSHLTDQYKVLLKNDKFRYDKSIPDKCYTKDRVNDAIKHAKERKEYLKNNSEDCEKESSFTDVYLVIESILRSYDEIQNNK